MLKIRGSEVIGGVEYSFVVNGIGELVCCECALIGTPQCIKAKKCLTNFNGYYIKLSIIRRIIRWIKRLN